MSQDPITLTLPLTETQGDVLLLALGLALAFGLVFLMLSASETKSAPTAATMAKAAAWALAPVWMVLFAATLWNLWQLLTGAPSDLNGSSNLGTGALIVALLGAPFLIWSTVIKHNTLETARKSLGLQETAAFNQKINDALQGLYSRRQITRPIKVGTDENAEEKILTEWQDDIVQRNGAIDRLGALARERPTEAPRIANILSVYVRELSKLSEPQSHPRQAWIDLVDPLDGSDGLTDAQARAKLGISPDEDLSVKALQTWTRGLVPFRTDVEKAVQTLGMLKRIPGVVVNDITLDLRKTNFQGFDLSELDLSKANLSHARMEGADLSEARMEAASLRDAQLEGASLSGTRLVAASLSCARMEGVNLRRATMKWANLFGTRLEEATLRDVNLEGANLTSARLEGADLFESQMEGANLSGARLNSANLWGVHMAAADFSNARFDSSTIWTNAKTCGASVQFLNFATTPITADQINQTFGDGSTQLPDHISWPAHWPMAKLDPRTFRTELEKWRENPDGYTPPDP